jgi:uncharacterized protein YjiS (DUF1127 family)
MGIRVVAVSIGWIWQAVALVREVVMREKIVHQLAGLNERELAEIGISRADIPAVARFLANAVGCLLALPDDGDAHHRADQRSRLSAHPTAFARLRRAFRLG